MSMLPSFSSAFGGAAHAPHSSHSGSRSGSGSSHNSVGASSATPSLSTSLAATPCPSRAARATPPPNARRAAPMAPHATAPKRPSFDPLPFEKFNLSVDGSSYLRPSTAPNGRGAPSQGSLTAGLFGQNLINLHTTLGVLEDSTHPDSTANTAAGPGSTTIDLNSSFQSSAVARHRTPVSMLRGPTQSDISALWNTPLHRNNCFESVPLDDPVAHHEQPAHSAPVSLAPPPQQLAASAPLTSTELPSASMLNAPFASNALPLVSAPLPLASSSMLHSAPSMPLSAQLGVAPSSNPLTVASMRLAASNSLAATSIPALVGSASPLMSNVPTPELAHVSHPLQAPPVQSMNPNNATLTVPSGALVCPSAPLGGLGIVPNKPSMMPFVGVSTGIDYPVSMLTMSAAAAKSSIAPFAPSTAAQNGPLTYPISIGGALPSTSPLVPSVGSHSVSHLQGDVQGLSLKQESLLMNAGAGPSRSVGGALGMDNSGMPTHGEHSLWTGIPNLGPPPRTAREAGPSSAGASVGAVDDAGRRTLSRKRPRSNVDGDGDLREQCPHCSMRARTRVGLQNHLRIVHKSGSEHKCAECSAEFPWKSTLENHVRLVHRKERPFQCQRCNKAFRWSSHLEEHVWVVHEHKKPFSCAICSKSFGRKNNMQKHMRKVHRLDTPR